MSDLKTYLAEKYMSGPKADAILARASFSASAFPSAPQKKKKKRKSAVGTGTALSNLRDEDGGWGGVGAGGADGGADDDEEDLREAVVASDRAFKKRRMNGDGDASTGSGGSSGGWATIREGTSTGMKEESPPPAADEAPVVVGVVDEEAQQQRKRQGKGKGAFTGGGLMSASQLKASMASTQAAMTPEMTGMSAEEIARAQETVYRDSAGRKIDTKAARAEAARAKREREEKQAQKMEWGKGIVQREERERQKEEMEKARAGPFSRRVDDVEMNEELKRKELWNDPAAAFITKSKSKGPRRPLYAGPPPPPNRFGIKPGYRWDGVDRGNGFEKKLFQSLNEKKRRGVESYQWSVDDM